MKNLKDIILEKLRVTKENNFEPEIIGEDLYRMSFENLIKWWANFNGNSWTEEQYIKSVLKNCDFLEYFYCEPNNLYTDYNSFYKFYMKYKNEIIEIKEIPAEFEEVCLLFEIDNIKYKLGASYSLSDKNFGIFK
jgi:hypothetical protein